MSEPNSCIHKQEIRNTVEGASVWASWFDQVSSLCENRLGVVLPEKKKVKLGMKEHTSSDFLQPLSPPGQLFSQPTPLQMNIGTGVVRRPSLEDLPRCLLPGLSSDPPLNC